MENVSRFRGKEIRIEKVNLKKGNIKMSIT